MGDTRWVSFPCIKNPGDPGLMIRTNRRRRNSPTGVRLLQDRVEERNNQSTIPMYWEEDERRPGFEDKLFDETMVGDLGGLTQDEITEYYVNWMYPAGMEFEEFVAMIEGACVIEDKDGDF